MDIPRLDVLPDASQTTSVVTPDANKEELPIAKESEPAVEPAPVSTEAKTPDNELYAALREERARRKEAEQKLKELESLSHSPEPEGEIFSDEGKFLKSQLSKVEEKLKTLETERQQERVFQQYPQIKDKLEEFDSFRDEYQGLALEKIAKLFLVEKGLLEPQVDRKGLERPTSGPKVAPISGISAAEVDRLRMNEPRKFIQMIREGKLKPEDVK